MRGSQLIGQRPTACDHLRNGEIGQTGERGDMGDWISGADAADIIGVHRNTVLASLTDPERRASWWEGPDGRKWRPKPLAKRGIYEVDAERAKAIADGTWPPPDETWPPATADPTP
jgi:hypothetical protein